MNLYIVNNPVLHPQGNINNPGQEEGEKKGEEGTINNENIGSNQDNINNQEVAKESLDKEINKPIENKENQTRDQGIIQENPISERKIMEGNEIKEELQANEN